MIDRNTFETNEYEYQQAMADAEWEAFCNEVEHERIPVTPQQLKEFKDMDPVLAAMSSEELQLAYNEYIEWRRGDLSHE